MTDPPPPLVARTFPGGVLHLKQERFPGALRRGRYFLDAAARIPLADVAALCAGPEMGSLEGAVFLDTETTGLGGGAGTFVFLVGMASFRGNELDVRQWLLPDPSEEEALLDALAAEAENTRVVVSFHGRGFDLPRLEERYLLHGREFPFENVPHLDLLLGARRVYKLRTQRVNLQRLEEEVLGITRLDDLPGAECPAAWYAYIRGRTEAMHRVLEHNLLDLLTLPALMSALADAVAGHGPAPDVHSAGRALARAGHEERALDLQRLAAQRAVDGGLASRAHEEAARLLRRSGSLDEAAKEALAASRADPGRPGPWLALSKFAEHHVRDYSAALEFARRVETILSVDLAPDRVRTELRHRIRRLQGKLERSRGD